MDHTVLTSKQTRTRLGQYLVDVKYRPDHVFCIEKTGEDDYVGVLCSPKLLRDKGIQVPARPPVLLYINWTRPNGRILP